MTKNENEKQERLEGRTVSDETIKKESMYINQSLSYLEQCVVALSRRNAGHVPYRQSKLTNVLKVRRIKEEEGKSSIPRVLLSRLFTSVLLFSLFDSSILSFFLLSFYLHRFFLRHLYVVFSSGYC